MLPENRDNNCFVIPHLLELCYMMKGQAPDKMIRYATQKGHFISYTGQKNPTGSVVLDFSVWYSLSGTHFRCVGLKLIVGFKLIYVPWVREK